MTDRHAGYIVTLAEDIREDDAAAVINALQMVRGVASVEPVVANHEMRMAQSRAFDDFDSRLITFIRTLREDHWKGGGDA